MSEPGRTPSPEPWPGYEKDDAQEVAEQEDSEALEALIAGRTPSGCGCPYDEHDAWCPLLNQPPTERDGLRVGDEVTLTSIDGRGPWPARIIGFQSTSDCCMAVEWLGRSPSLDPRNTVCRKTLTVTAPASSPSR